MKKLVLIAATSFAFIGAEVHAQMGAPAQGGGQRPDFASLDADSDGLLSVEEMASLNSEERPNRAENMLSRMDADSDGLLNEEEFNTRPERGAGGGGGNRGQ